MLVIDVGNTNVTAGVLEDMNVVDILRAPTEILGSKKKAIQFFKDLKNTGIKNAVACSVVPDVNPALKEACRRSFGVECKLAGQDFTVPVMNRYRIPSQVGQDRLVNAYAGLKLFGKGLIIVDFGTAITFDIVSKKGEYLGGLIAPGLRLMQESLDRKTALLPFVELARPIELIGKDTVSSIRAGIIFGSAGLCEGILSRLLEKECRSYKVIVTGGDAPIVKPYCPSFEIMEENLTLKGLALIGKSFEVSMVKPY